MFVLLFFAFVITMAIFLLGHWVGRKTQSTEKLMPFECGNDTEGVKGGRVFVKYSLTALLFVVFDVEVVFMYPWATLFKSLGWGGVVAMTSFIGTVLVALAYCWKKGAFEWDV
jgi:NADH-quinone oxidoreductase subunit A